MGILITHNILYRGKNEPLQILVLIAEASTLGICYRRRKNEQLKFHAQLSMKKAKTPVADLYLWSCTVAQYVDILMFISRINTTYRVLKPEISLFKSILVFMSSGNFIKVL